MSDDITVKAGSILDNITIKVKGLGSAVLRVRIARWIFELGALVAGCAVEIEMDDKRA